MSVLAATQLTAALWVSKSHWRHMDVEGNDFHWFKFLAIENNNTHSQTCSDYPSYPP